jgi:hypothetical protein
MKKEAPRRIQTANVLPLSVTKKDYCPETFMVGFVAHNLSSLQATIQSNQKLH